MIRDVKQLSSQFDSLCIKIYIYISAVRQKAQLQTIEIEEGILCVENLHPIIFVSSGGKDVQVNLDGVLEDRK